MFRAGTDNTAGLLVRIPKDPVSAVKVVLLEGDWLSPFCPTDSREAQN